MTPDDLHRHPVYCTATPSERGRLDAAVLGDWQRTRATWQLDQTTCGWVVPPVHEQARRLQTVDRPAPAHVDAMAAGVLVGLIALALVRSVFYLL